MQSDPSVEQADAGRSPGARLRQARAARGETVGEVAATLRLSRRQIEALESDDYAALPGPAFAQGFLRNYARYLGLDPAPLLVEAQSRFGTPQVTLTLVSNARGELPQRPGRRLRTLPLGILTAVLVLALGLGWYFDGFRTSVPEAAADTNETVVVQPLTVQTPQIIPEPVPAQPPSLAVMVAPPPVAAPVPAAPVPAAPAVPVPAATVPAATVPSSSAAVAQPKPALAAPVEPVVPAATDTASVAPAPDGWLQFRFAAQSWIEIRDAERRILYSGVNRAGTSRMVQGQRPFALMINNADTVSLEFNGQPVDLAPHTSNGKARLTLK